jgi:hypothetical protein
MITFRMSGVAAAATLLLSAVTPAAADDDDWAGLYQGLDALDGSVDYMSIVPLGDGKFDIRVVPSVNSYCDSGVGWNVADGRLENDGTLVRENVTVYCDGDEPRSVSDGVYARDDDTGIVTLEHPDDGRKLYYHRISGD